MSLSVDPSSTSRAQALLALVPLVLTCGCVRAGFEEPGEVWVSVPAATFAAGSTTSTPCRHDNQDLHTITLTRSFEIQATEVTQAQYQALMGDNPAYFSSCGADCPVEMVTWHDAAAYCNALSARDGYEACYRCASSGVQWSCTPGAATSIYACAGYRLPTDAEWELAYRAGTTTTFYSGEVTADPCDDCAPGDANADAIGWYCNNAGGATHPVAQKQANALGLYDMAGNVWEWCHDPYQKHLGSTPVTDPQGPPSSSLRMVRGGAWINYVNALYAAQRYARAAEYFNNGVGFRCVRTAR